MMNKRILILILFCIVFSVNSICLAYPNEKNGFRDFYWGESMQEVQANDEVYDLKYSGYDEETNSVFYVGKLTNPYISGQEMDNIFFMFWNNKLCWIGIYFSNEKYINVLDSMKINFGYPKFKNNEYYWYGQQTDIVLCSLGGYYACIIINNPYLWNEAKRDGAIRGW